MSKIKIVDARMGRGKTSAAEQYMASEKGKKRFLYITPYLTEVSRICDACDFEQPDSDTNSKLHELKVMMHKGRNVASTHALFYLLDDETLELIREKQYSIIIDEAIETVSHVPVTDKDLAYIVNTFAEVDDESFVHWKDPEYEGKFDGYKSLADTGSLCLMDTSLIKVIRPELLSSFQEVIMMTYLFNGQYQKAYLEYFNMEYTMCGIDTTGGGFRFTDKPDDPPPMDYKSLIHIVDDQKLNEIGDNKFALSKSWYDRRKADHKDIKKMRSNLRVFFEKRCKAPSSDQLWTCFKSDNIKLTKFGQKQRFIDSYLQPTARATNAYRSRSTVAYLINRFMDPSVSNFFGQRGVSVDADEFALSEMLQFIWRSAIRDNKPITLYVPSRRMRELLIDWIEKNSRGAETNDEV